MRCGLFGLVLAALVLSARGCEQKGMDDRSQGGLAPAGGEAPLLLEDGPGAEEPAGPMADNSRCHVCHINYVKEEIALVHARAEIACAGCHGESDAHIADESWASGGNGTPPDIMYPSDRINPFCMTCHPKSKIDAKQHKPLFAAGAKKKHCTDCHGSHRLPQRKCKWK